MPRLSELNPSQRLRLLEDILKLFLAFCKQEFDVILYDYQIKVARAALSTLFVESQDLYVKIARQAGKTEVLTLLLKFLIIYYVQFVKRRLCPPLLPLMVSRLKPTSTASRSLLAQAGYIENTHNLKLLQVHIADQVLH